MITLHFYKKTDENYRWKLFMFCLDAILKCIGRTKSFTYGIFVSFFLVTCHKQVWLRNVPMFDERNVFFSMHIGNPGAFVIIAL